MGGGLFPSGGVLFRAFKPRVNHRVGGQQRFHRHLRRGVLFGQCSGRLAKISQAAPVIAASTKKPQPHFDQLADMAILLAREIPI